ncbi:MAG: ATP-binding cassette domain-containing protein [Cyanobacteriota bacterium]|nr:ATP-binding cassette domain-containing protein [Cyanobacteriota bacterium]
MSNGINLEVTNLNKYFGNKPVLQNIRLQVSSGEFVVIIGKSGCGKSTLLRLIAGLDKPTQGEIWLDHRPLKGVDPSVRIMFQDARLLPWRTVQQNISLGLTGNWQHQTLEVLSHVGLLDRAKDWPAILSGGQRQRVALARALVHHPRLLLLDEPLGALDALTRIEMQRLIEKLWQEQQFTSILVTHDVGEAIALADRVILIEQGSIALDVPITLPRPRQRGSATFAALEEQILNRILIQPESAFYHSSHLAYQPT